MTLTYGGECVTQLLCCESVTVVAPEIPIGPATAAQFELVPPAPSESEVPGPKPTWAELCRSTFVGEPFLIKPPRDFATEELAELVAQPPEEPLTCVDALDALFPVIVEVLLLQL